jgi:acyl carrier protein
MEVGRDAMLFSRLGIGGMCIGAMKRCAQQMGRYASRREIASGRLADHAVSVARLQDLTASIFAAESLVYAIAARLDGGNEVPVEAYIACKTTGSELLGIAADGLVQMLGGRGYIESNGAPQILRDARVLRILEGPTETLYSHLGASVGQKNCATTRFISEALARPDLAADLTQTVARIKAAAAQREGLFASAAALSQWLDYRIGELAANAFLLAASESRQAGAPHDSAAHAIAWARARYTAVSTEVLADIDGRAPYSASTALLRQIDGYVDAIGDVEQALPGENDKLDPVLRRNAAPQPAPVPAAPVIEKTAAPAPKAAATADLQSATPMQRIVHECVMKWLRSENKNAPDSIDFDTPFTSLGMDSLATASISFELEERIGFAIIPELLYDNQTVEQLAAFIDSRLKSQPVDEDSLADSEA